MPEKRFEKELAAEDGQSTRVISHSFEHNGIPFSWWAVGDDPALVTVSSQWFGRKSEFHPAGDEATARTMAAAMLEEKMALAEEIRDRMKAKSDRRTVK